MSGLTMILPTLIGQAVIWLELDPNAVKAGWLPLFLVVGLFGLIVLGYFSMRHQISKISVPFRDELDRESRDSRPDDPGTAPGESKADPAQP